MQQFLKPPTGAAWAWIVAAELLEKLLAAADYAIAALDARLGRIAFAPLTCDLETRTA
jgi:hypothetical protein